MTESEATQDPQKPEEQKSRITTLLSHPVVIVLSLAGLLLTFIGFPLSIYFYYAAKEYPQLTYYPHPVKATVVRAGDASRLSAIFDNKPIETDITAAQIAIWNQGGRAIRRGQVLRPLVIFTENNTPVLEATIRKTSREVTRLILIQDELQKGRVIVEWDILEKNDGGVIQLIYAGNTDVQLKVDGVIEGQPHIERIEFTGKIKSPHAQYESERWGYKGWGVILFALGLLLLLGAWLLRFAKGDFRKSSARYIKTLERTMRRYERYIEFENNEITTFDNFIADVEEQVKQAEKIAADEQIDAEQLVAFPRSRIEGYRKLQEGCRERIKGYELVRDKDEVEKAEVMRTARKEERRFDIFILGVIALALLVFVPAVYLFFIAQPVGPPFGF